MSNKINTVACAIFVSYCTWFTKRNIYCSRFWHATKFQHNWIALMGKNILMHERRSLHQNKIFDCYACIYGVMKMVERMLFIWQVSRYKCSVTQSYKQVNAGGYRWSAVFDTQGLADVTGWSLTKLAAGYHILKCTRVFSFVCSLKVHLQIWLKVSYNFFALVGLWSDTKPGAVG